MLISDWSSDVCSSDLVLLNPHGDYDINPAGYVIHSAVHGARHDVECVIHTHSRAGMAVSALECGLLPLTQTAMRFGTIAHHEYEGPAVDTDERARLTQDRKSTRLNSSH